MKKKIQFALLALLSLSTTSIAQVSSSKWQAQPLIIDGEASDWSTNPRFFNAESNVQYEFRNDAQNLYVVLKTMDRATQMQFMRAGFTVRFKIKTDVPLKCSISFPAHKMNGMSRQMKNQGVEQNQLIEKMNSKLEMMPKDTAILEGFQLTNGIITSDNKNDNTIRFAKNKGNKEQVMYEMSIPLAELYGKDFVLGKVSSKSIQLQVTINDLSQSSGNKQGGMGKGMRGGGNGGGMHGGMSGESMGREMGGESNMGERPQMPEGGGSNGSSMAKKSFNIDFRLSAGN